VTFFAYLAATRSHATAPIASTGRLFYYSTFKKSLERSVSDGEAFQLCCDVAATNNGWVILDQKSTYVIGRPEGYTLKTGLQGIICKDSVLELDSSIDYLGPAFTVTANNCQLDQFNIIVSEPGKLRPNSRRIQTILYVVGKNVSVRHARLRGAARHFILGAAGCDGLHVLGTKISTTGASDVGIYIGDKDEIITHGVNIQNVIVEGDALNKRNQIQRHSIGLFNCSASIVAHCEITGGGETGFGISLNRCRNTKVFENSSFDTVRESINATQSVGIEIRANRCYWHQGEHGALFGTDFGISIEGSSYTSILENEISGALKSGIACAADTADSFENKISNNRIKDCAWGTKGEHFAIITYATNGYKNTRNTIKQNIIANSPGIYTAYDYFELPDSVSEVGYNSFFATPPFSGHQISLTSTSRFVGE
jgi:hypothetical protein